jgi:predicted nucleic acid-binding protein
MILYLDTSALLKKYFSEIGSAEVISGWKVARAIVTSSVTYAEIMASIHRKKREESIRDRIFARIIQSFQQDWNGFIRIGVTNDLNEVIDRIVAAHPLRGFDAIHLASALIVRESLTETFLFACFDTRLLKAAQIQGLDTLPA